MMSLRLAIDPLRPMVWHKPESLVAVPSRGTETVRLQCSQYTQALFRRFLSLCSVGIL